MARKISRVAGALLTALVLSNCAARRAPDFTLPEVYGGEVSLASYHGHRVLLVFWTTS